MQFNSLSRWRTNAFVVFIRICVMLLVAVSFVIFVFVEDLPSAKALVVLGVVGLAAAGQWAKATENLLWPGVLCILIWIGTITGLAIVSDAGSYSFLLLLAAAPLFAGFAPGPAIPLLTLAAAMLTAAGLVLGASLGILPSEPPGADIALPLAAFGLTIALGYFCLSVMTGHCDRLIKKLAHENEALRAMANEIPLCFIVLDSEFRVQAGSRLWLAETGLSADDVLGRHLDSIITPIPESWRAAHKSCLEGEAVDLENELFMTPDDTGKWVTLRARPWRAEGSRMRGTLFVFEWLHADTTTGISASI
ncbi:PAS domain S-box protein [Pelagibacterium halotolerans]|uniref:PAS domain S-box protein n=1 Tax=Pelagibacterium halotolerans TaxID=531813 RepID=UPI00384A9C1E